MSSNFKVDFLDPSKHWIAIVGVGQGGASTFSSLVDRVISADLADRVGIILFDARPYAEYGRGIAWSSGQLPAFRANMRLPTMGFKKSLIKKILGDEDLDSAETVANLSDEVLYQQRFAIGNVLHEDFLGYRKEAKDAGIEVHVRHEDVADIVRHGAGFALIPEGSSSAPVFAHTTVLALGNLPNHALSQWRTNSRYFHNPWKWDQYSKIASGSSVLVAGQGPTAVDAILALADRGAKKIVAFSRSGRFQYPRPNNTPFDLRHLTKELIQDHLELRLAQGEVGLNFDFLETMLRHEFISAKPCEGWNKAHKNSTQKNARDALASGIEDCNKSVEWYSVLKAIDSVTPVLWDALNDEARQGYYKKYQEDHRILSFGMASPQAKKILDLIDRKTLTLHKGDVELSYDDKKSVFSGTSNKKTIGTFDYVFNCTGIGKKLSDCENKLVRELVRKGWIIEHPHGGGLVDFNTGHLLNSSSKKYAELYALVGSLTMGTHLLTHCLFQVWQSADRTAQSIARNIAATTPASADSLT